MKEKVVDAFGYFGAVVRNIRWSWSGRTPDDSPVQAVALLIWKNEEGSVLQRGTDRLVIDNFGSTRFPNWRDKPGNKHRIKDLQWAIDNCNGHFRVVWGKMDDPEARQPHAIERYPDKNLLMKIKRFAPATGKFIAESVSGWTGKIPEPEVGHAEAAAAALGSRGGKARAQRLTPEQRTESARQAARRRWREA
jgi:hypothetical protein